jgi:hypothetical protein
MFQFPIGRNIVIQSERFFAKSYLNPATPKFLMLKAGSSQYNVV